MPSSKLSQALSDSNAANWADVVLLSYQFKLVPASDNLDTWLDILSVTFNNNLRLDDDLNNLNDTINVQLGGNTLLLEQSISDDLNNWNDLIYLLSNNYLSLNDNLNNLSDLVNLNSEGYLNLIDNLNNLNDSVNLLSFEKLLLNDNLNNWLDNLNNDGNNKSITIKRYQRFIIGL